MSPIDKPLPGLDEIEAALADQRAAREALEAATATRNTAVRALLTAAQLVVSGGIAFAIPAAPGVAKAGGDLAGAALAHVLGEGKPNAPR